MAVPKDLSRDFGARDGLISRVSPCPFSISPLSCGDAHFNTQHHGQAQQSSHWQCKDSLLLEQRLSHTHTHTHKPTHPPTHKPTHPPTHPRTHTHIHKVEMAWTTDGRLGHSSFHDGEVGSLAELQGQAVPWGTIGVSGGFKSEELLLGRFACTISGTSLRPKPQQIHNVKEKTPGKTHTIVRSVCATAAKASSLVCRLAYFNKRPCRS